MRRPIIAGNWKMNTAVAEAVGLATHVRAELSGQAELRTEVVLCPPFPSLSAVAVAVENTAIGVGAQNCYPADDGAFTGEVSAPMLAAMCQYVIVGHSERRGYFSEDDAFVQAKAAHVLAHELTPIVCVGESLKQHEAGTGRAFVTSQTTSSLKNLSADAVGSLVIAYEPIWAIGTALAATAEDANTMIREIRATVAEGWGDAAAERVRIQYGGSVAAANAGALLAEPEIDGALVGGASLRADEFAAIVAAAEALAAQ
ncbi:MAG: triose-phosphate isomerase [Dehalococcoidia bacterium]|nr:triose-phosphate isomerase [Dehalococcoidia bacterium]